MPAVVFYEKPGCATNARQRRLLAGCGCEVIVRNLLTEPWTAGRLYGFLHSRPVEQWFNPAAPRVKSGEIDPAAQDEAGALALLLADPLLIRRPLLDTEFGKTAGFDDPQVLGPLGVYDLARRDDQGCSRPGDAPACPAPER